LARLGGRNKFLLQSPSASIASSLQWTAFRRHLSVSVPVASDLMVPQSSGLSQSQSQRSFSQQSRQVEVNVGAVVPRLVQLCTDTRPESRQLRLYAQECLHGITMLMIGRAAHLTAADISSIGDDYQAMFGTIFPTIIILSVSDDSVTKQLFDKLLFQVIHWLSSSCDSSPHLRDIYAGLLEHLMDGTSGDLESGEGSDAGGAAAGAGVYDGASSRSGGSVVIRDRCVTAVVECFRWACKHSQVSKGGSSSETGAGESVTTTSADGILARLLTLSSHPIERKRLGAVRVLNQLYVYFREDLLLVYKYALRVMFVVLNAVKQPGRGGGASSSCSTSQATCAQAVTHYTKIIVKVSERDELDAACIR
jgi:hypothetical protein